MRSGWYGSYRCCPTNSPAGGAQRHGGRIPAGEVPFGWFGVFVQSLMKESSHGNEEEISEEEGSQEIRQKEGGQEEVIKEEDPSQEESRRKVGQEKSG
jgi:hypothetical protein